jgi:hydroxylamine reductase (hybrid-cluster protein)
MRTAFLMSKIYTMNMFCFQCQEAAKGIGCKVKGVCGKDSNVSNLQDTLLFVSNWKTSTICQLHTTLRGTSKKR